MNKHSLNEPGLDADSARTLVDRLRDWAATASDADIAAVDPGLSALVHRPGPPSPAPTGPAPTDTQPVDTGRVETVLSTSYPEAFRPDQVYRATLPDLQNGPASAIRGARRDIQHVGISNFRLPLEVRVAGTRMMLEASVTGTVSLAAERKGINMSRIMRSFYRHADDTVDFDLIDAALDDYRRDLGSEDARILLRLRVPMKVQSLRSGLSGWQYYDTAMDVVQREGLRTRILHLDYVYASTCPCSLELAEHARRERHQLATPHSQRSVARLSAVLDPDAPAFDVGDLVSLCRRAVPTETQVVAKREDEQAFAELNGANPIFVEDAVRLFAQGLADDPRIGDFRVVASHQESLHSHDAVSILTEGGTFHAEAPDPHLFGTLVHSG